MESRTKFLGHPIHPILVAFPLGLFIIAVIFDVLYLLTQNTALATAAYYDIAAGILGGLAAAIFGVLDWLAIPKATRAKRIGLFHGLSNVVLLLLFIASWLLRNGSPAYLPDTAAFLLGVVGVAFGGFSGWLGGELVYRLRVGVDTDANLDASNSLSRTPTQTSTDVVRN